MPFLFTGTIDKLTFKLGLEQISGEERKVAERVLAAAHDLTLLEELPDWGVRISGLSASV